MLNIIKHDHHFEAIPCCNAMLDKWLQVDTTASWEKLFAVIESPAVSCDEGDYTIVYIYSHCVHI